MKVTAPYLEAKSCTDNMLVCIAGWTSALVVGFCGVALTVI